MDEESGERVGKCSLGSDSLCDQPEDGQGELIDSETSEELQEWHIHF